MPELLLPKTEQAIRALGLSAEEKYGLAFSGGPDSTFLAYMLHRLGFRRIVLLYVNYHDSPETPLEEKAVKTAAKTLGYRLIISSVTQLLKSGNFESIARKIRYLFFEEAAAKSGLKAVLTAHQQDDLLETYIMQKMRGGIVRHYGISPESQIGKVRILRPLLGISKKDIVGYLNFSHIGYYDDKTNMNLERTRNWIRFNILPGLDREKTLLEIERANEELAKRQAETKAYYAGPTPYRQYSELPEETKLSLLYDIISEKQLKNIDADRLLTGRNLAYENLRKPNTTKETDLKCGLSLYRNRGSFYIMPHIEQIPYSHKISAPGLYDFSELRIDLTEPGLFNLRPDSFPITLRSVRPDDRIATDLVHDSVSSFIRSAKVPVYLRSFYPVIEDCRGKIVFVPFFDDLRSGKIPMRLKKYII